MEKLTAVFPSANRRWTAGVPLPGGDFPVDGVQDQIANLKARFPFLSDYWAARLVRAYGVEAQLVLGTAKTAGDLGRDFGATMTEAELRWLMTHEFACRAADVVWRRSKLGLRMTADQISALDAFMLGVAKETTKDGALSPAAE
jgi:glycerol-3-phosphate dehydrogenase